MAKMNQNFPNTIERKIALSVSPAIARNPIGMGFFLLGRVKCRSNEVEHRWTMAMIEIRWQNSMMKKIEVVFKKMDLLLVNMVEMIFDGII